MTNSSEGSKAARKRWDAANPDVIAASKKKWADANPEARARAYKDADVRKADQLGMNFSSASHRLKKMLMFKLIQQLSLDTCYRCNIKIGTAEELSIDHKIDWLHGDATLFWDLDNIAYSHRRCNVKRKS